MICTSHSRLLASIAHASSPIAPLCALSRYSASQHDSTHAYYGIQRKPFHTTAPIQYSADRGSGKRKPSRAKPKNTEGVRPVKKTKRDVRDQIEKKGMSVGPRAFKKLVRLQREKPGRDVEPRPVDALSFLDADAHAPVQPRGGDKTRRPRSKKAVRLQGEKAERGAEPPLDALTFLGADSHAPVQPRGGDKKTRRPRSKKPVRSQGEKPERGVEPRPDALSFLDADSHAPVQPRGGDKTRPPRSEKPARSQGEKAGRGDEARPPRSGPQAPPEEWRVQKDALAAKFKGEKWNPRKRLSPDALDGIRAMHAEDPELFSTPVLAEQFKITPEAIRRILRSKWRPTEAEAEDRQLRWDRRGEKIWTRMAELGTRPPKKWREMGVGRAPPGGIPKYKKSAIREREEAAKAVPWSDDGQSIPRAAPRPRQSLGNRIL